MIIAQSHVQPACARIVLTGRAFTFHRISKPVFGAIPTFTIDTLPSAQGASA